MVIYQNCLHLKSNHPVHGKYTCVLLENFSVCYRNIDYYNIYCNVCNIFILESYSEGKKKLTKFCDTSTTELDDITQQPRKRFKKHFDDSIIVVDESNLPKIIKQKQKGLLSM